MTNNQQPKFGGQSPWGRIEYLDVLAPGIVFVHTQSHGGIWLSDERIAQIPEELRVPARSYAPKPVWWEEDCEITFPLWFFGALIQDGNEHNPEKDQVLSHCGYFGSAWLNRVQAMHVKPVCCACGSDGVSADARATWSDDKQDWECEEVHPNSDYCHACEGETSTKFVATEGPRNPIDEPYERAS